MMRMLLFLRKGENFSDAGIELNEIHLTEDVEKRAHNLQN
jgi:phage protein D